MAVNGIWIKVGQVWKDGSGATIHITHRDDEDVHYPWRGSNDYSYTKDGIFDRHNPGGRFNLVELITEPSDTALLGDSHEALTFHPLPEVSDAARTSEPVLGEAIAAQLATIEGEGAAAHATVTGLPKELFSDPPVDPGRTNPKDLIGDKKLALHLLSPIAEAHWVVGQYAGMLKYGAWNWREAGVRASVYISAARRHIAAYLSGEEFDPTDGSHHLGNVMACAAILLEAREIGKLTDDRPPCYSHRPAYAWAEDRMAQLKVQYADKFPKHYTIADRPPKVDRKKPDDTEGGEV